MKNFEIFLIDVPALIRARQAAAHGFKTEQTCVLVIEHTLQKMHKETMECMCRDCVTLMDNKFTTPKAFAVCIPMFPMPGDDAIACAICDGCADRPDLLERMVEAMRELLPDFSLAQPGERKQ
jgi:hypothetical protein